MVSISAIYNGYEVEAYATQGRSVLDKDNSASALGLVNDIPAERGTCADAL
ncbi:hypothetical protein MMC24_003619 [Lignoscripta atroalba]|nr:hypothetical protein [Lignoscripta atroalba]